MDKFNPGVFSTLYETETGQKMWVFMNEPKMVSRMITATDLGRPAVEGIEEPLLAEFRDAVLENRMKQMIGRMAKQIMEGQGYIIDQKDVKITNGAPFSRGARYKKRDAMTYYAHKSNQDTRDIALTADKAGIHLPNDENRWTYWKSFESGLRARIAFGLEDEKTPRENIAKDGYHIYRMERLLQRAR
jgi:hypothetical protein